MIELFLLVCAAKLAASANILCLNAAATHSHFEWNNALVGALAARGHNVTVLSVDVDPKRSVPGAHYIHLERAYEGLLDQRQSEEINEDLIGYLVYNQFRQIPLVYKYFEKNCHGVVKSNGFAELLNYPDNFKFDLVIHDYTCGACSLGFLHKFNYPPLVGVTPFNNPPYNLDLVGGHLYPAYIPYFSTTYSINMTFLERLHNAAVYYADYWYRQYICTPILDAIVRPYFSEDMPSLDELQRKTQLVLVNSHPATNYPEPTASNVIEVGGLQISEPQPLPEDIDSFINQAKKGAIFISMGSNVKSEHLGSRRCKMFLEVIGAFKDYNFLWKIDSKVLGKNPPKNLLTREWFSQRDILAHPKIKAFVTHAGALSTHEAFWYGVPMVGLPVFIDQHRNLEKSVSLGVAIKVDLMKMTRQDLQSAIESILEDPQFSERIKRRSQLYRDRPMKPADAAVWWIEYVIRTKDLEHLKSPVMHLGVIRSNLFDVLAFVIVIFLLLLISFSIIFMRFFKFILQGKKTDKRKEKKN